MNVAQWIRTNRFHNVFLEIANEYGHGGFDHHSLKTAQGQAELIGLAKKTAPGLLVSTSGLGGGTLDETVARTADFLLHCEREGIAFIPWFPVQAGSLAQPGGLLDEIPVRYWPEVQIEGSKGENIIQQLALPGSPLPGHFIVRKRHSKDDCVLMAMGNDTAYSPIRYSISRAPCRRSQPGEPIDR